MPFFDDSHVTDVGLQGSAGPTVGAWDYFTQSVEQQFRVDSQQALQEEIRNRWLENLETFATQGGQRFEEPPTLTAYTRYLDNIEGKEPGWFDDFDLETKAGVKRLEEADLAIRQSGGKSFSEVVQEVYAMQRETEERTASMGERAGVGATVAGFAGATVGSFSTRDPLNVISLPIGGGGRTIATRIALEMAVGGAVVAATDVVAVMPNRARAGLPERSLLYDVAAGAIGAGVIRGGFEGIAAGSRAFRANGVKIDLDFEDAQLREMLGQVDSPRSRAGESILDDTVALERANPYGEGPTADARFYAELNEMQRSLGGEPMTAVARVLPPIPIEVVDNALDFKLVKEQAPAVWARLEEAQARVTALERTAEATPGSAVSPSGRFAEINRDEFGNIFIEYRPEGSDIPIPIKMGIDDGVAEIAVDQFSTLSNRLGPAKVREAMTDLMQMYPEIESFGGFRRSGAGVGRVQEIPSKRLLRQQANRQYQAAYAAVEREAASIRKVEALMRGTQQREAVDLLGTASAGRPWVGPSMRHDVVEARVAKIDEAAEAIPDRADFIAKQVPDDEGLVDIGLGKKVPASMRIPFDDGEMTIQEILDDFIEDDLLDEAMRTCLI